MKDSDLFGWNHQMDIDPYVNNIENIKEFSSKIDKDLNCIGCGFLLAFIYHSKKPLDLFYKKYGYFPYDSYLDLWENITSKYDIYDGQFKKPTYNHRNDAIKALVSNNFLIEVGNVIQVNKNPYEKVVNRNNNLNLLIE